MEHDPQGGLLSPPAQDMSGRLEILLPIEGLTK
jgi:hypothetical protein